MRNLGGSWMNIISVVFLLLSRIILVRILFFLTF